MGMFDYRRYSAAESAELANTSFGLAVFGQLQPIYESQIGSLAKALGQAMPPGVTANPINVALPPAGRMSVPRRSVSAPMR